ncbi:helix-turn-helix domain-containing protein [Aeoliella mucimassa]|uniref:Helix-turn-helix domain protein n=1 Tax=Aeoliella mucimassa TaxID=2527972 RepID=A0A518AP02_9BACT|nr:helix-turn-helix domain-containing protein [Aeoliella mucimassa]QDU56421.1 Helix-turn-helix domain protein [Aeoliella mucimassa]
MDPKFVTMDDAAQQLNISPDQLNALREQGKLRAYRDGSSWKFRKEEIERMQAEGIPQLDAEDSGINLDFDDLTLGDDLGLDDSSDGSDSIADDMELTTNDPSFSDIQLEDDDELELDLTTGSSADVTLNLDDESPAPPTQVSSNPPKPPVDEEDDILDLELDSGDDPESILLSESELGDSPDRPPSTIIGRSDLDDALDLELASDSDAAKSDVQLADLEDLDSNQGTGDLPVGEASDSAFDNIEELEIDLEAESSRILSPEDVAAAQAAAASNQAQQKAAETSDLDLDLDDDYGLVGSDIGLSGLDGDKSGSELSLDDSPSGDVGLSGLSALELDSDDDDDDDDFVLGDGSDVTLSAADSGINLSPADSGLSLDDAALDLAGSSIGSGIDFGEASGLVSDEPMGDFELTPMEEDAGADDEDDSSQVIALDAFEENQEADDLLGGGGDDAAAGMGAAAMPAGAGFSQTAVVPKAEVQFTGWQVVFLTMCLVLLSLCGMMALDVVRSMWSWEEPYAVNSSLIDSLSGFLFP